MRGAFRAMYLSCRTAPQTRDYSPSASRSIPVQARSMPDNDKKTQQKMYMHASHTSMKCSHAEERQATTRAGCCISVYT